ncbi:origin recognition complex subunit 6 [Malaya genurostris]|uniref:origin recognition complex subunit 6 n=1 Tax=Malaya genurostris TaxID=325434 RepID=UPI0026F40361|nr:origin recognition complex subunit 6 [Malaya genurostris]
MVNTENKLLLQMIQKLGLAEHEQIAPKSTELLRLLQVKSAGGVANLGDYAKAVICIDLASSHLGVPCDSEMTLKLSGLKKSAYANNKRTLEKLLDINQLMGINEICIQLGLHQVQKEATFLLNSYKSFVDGRSAEIDFTHPQYATMSVFQACKRIKVKPPKAKLVSLSHLKPAQWSLLEKNWENFLVNSSGLNSATSKLKQPKASETLEQTENLEEKRCHGLKHNSPEKVEPYGNWKKRMLEKAYRELKSLQGR